MKKIDIKIIILSLIFIFVLLIIVTSKILLSQKQILNHSSYASSSTAYCNNTAVCQCSDPTQCFSDGCSRDPSKNSSVCGNNGLGPVAVDGSYLCTKEPDCCQAMVAKQNAYACCWIERGYCKSSTCAQVGNASGSKCGWYWSFHDPYTQNGYGCMVGPDPNNMRPICGGSPPQPTSTPNPTNPPSQPTSTPKPTRTPTPRPTTPFSTPTTVQPTQPAGESPNPTNPSVPTATPYQYPTNQPNSISPTSSSVFSFPTTGPITSPAGQSQQPSIFSTILRIVSSSPTFPPIPSFFSNGITRINEEAPKTLDIFEFIFGRIIYYDRMLEYGINSKIFFLNEKK